VAAGKEPRPPIDTSGFVYHANKLLLLRQHLPV